MELSLQLERARMREAELAEKRKAAWDLDPGNTNGAHVYRNAQGYHFAWTEWRAAHDRRVAIEREFEQRGRR